MKNNSQHILLTITLFFLVTQLNTEVAARSNRNLHLFRFDPFDFVQEIYEVSALIDKLDKGEGSKFGDQLYEGAFEENRLYYK